MTDKMIKFKKEDKSLYDEKNNCIQRDINYMTLLSNDFQPGIYDVICARGKKVQKHIGNERFRKIISMYLHEYSLTTTKKQKTIIVSYIVDCVRKYTINGGGFVRKINNLWYEVGDHIAREKIGQW